MPQEEPHQRYLRYLAANIRACRRNSGLTQGQLAEVTGIDERYMQRIERGTINISMKTLVVLAEALDVKPGFLLRKRELPAAKPGRPH